MIPIWMKRITAGLTLLSMAAVASAQYVWLDEKGVKQYSDIPPPASVPDKNILKQAGRAYVAPQKSSADDSETKDSATNKNADADEAKAPMTMAEKNAEFLKRKAKRAEEEAKTAEDAKNAAIKAKNCENTRNYNRSLTSGARIATTNQNGERSYLTDAQRTKEIQESQAVLKECQ